MIWVLTKMIKQAAQKERQKEKKRLEQEAKLKEDQALDQLLREQGLVSSKDCMCLLA